MKTSFFIVALVCAFSGQSARATCANVWEDKNTNSLWFDSGEKSGNIDSSNDGESRLLWGCIKRLEAKGVETANNLCFKGHLVNGNYDISEMENAGAVCPE